MTIIKSDLKERKFNENLQILRNNFSLFYIQIKSAFYKLKV